MKILACFDCSSASESSLAHLAKIARIGDEVLLFSVVEPPDGRSRMRGPLRPLVEMATAPSAPPVLLHAVEPRAIETKGQALARGLSARTDYLKDLMARLPKGPTHACEAVVDGDAASAIIRRAMVLQPDLVVMATHGVTGRIHILFGDVAEEVVRSGVSPVLLVHPESVRIARKANRL